MIHDGIPDGNGGYVFTSVDGKILPAGPADTHDTSLTSLESSVFREHMNRDMVNQSIDYHKYYRGTLTGVVE